MGALSTWGKRGLHELGQFIRLSDPNSPGSRAHYLYAAAMKKKAIVGHIHVILLVSSDSLTQSLKVSLAQTDQSLEPSLTHAGEADSMARRSAEPPA